MDTLQTAISIVHAYVKDCQSQGYTISRASICHFDFIVGSSYGIEILLVSAQFGNDLWRFCLILKLRFRMAMPYIDGVLKWGLEVKVC